MKAINVEKTNWSNKSVSMLKIFIYGAIGLVILYLSTILPISSVGIVISVITLVVVIMQLNLMERQTKIIASRAELLTKAECDEAANKIILIAENTGERGLDSFDWHLWIHDSLVGCLTVIDKYRGDITTKVSDEINGENYHHYMGCFRDHLYPTREKTFAELALKPSSSINGTYKFYTQIACDDGVFPEKFEDAPLPVVIRLQHRPTPLPKV